MTSRLTKDQRHVAIRTLQLAEQLRMSARPDGDTWKQAWRARERWSGRWERWAQGFYEALQSQIEIPAMVRDADELWAGTTTKRWFQRATPKEPTPPTPETLRNLVQLADPGSWLSGAVASYLQLALDMGGDAGQFTLDALGINRTFAWTSARNIAQSVYAVHGSKVLTNAYETHLRDLARIVLNATKPESPQAMSEIVSQIRQEWTTLARWQAERIARSETANVWETTNFNVMVANGVQSFEVLLASGPSIGITVGAACDYCVQQAAGGVYTMTEADNLPPYHPNCRCTAVPQLTNPDGTYWLPPADPYTGGDLSDPITPHDINLTRTPSER